MGNHISNQIPHVHRIEDFYCVIHNVYDHPVLGGDKKIAFLNGKYYEMDVLCKKVRKEQCYCSIGSDHITRNYEEEVSVLDNTALNATLLVAFAAVGLFAYCVIRRL